MILKNRENESAFHIDPEWHTNRRPGISVYYRIKNEGDFIRASILSLLDWVDEVIVGLQPCKDNTREEIERIKSDKITICEYPFTLWPNGPGFKDQDPTSVHSKTYFYNWTLAQTTRKWTLKWDGDMIALPSLRPLLDCTEGRTFTGHEIVKIEGERMWMSATHPVSNAAPSGFFRVKPDIEYVNAEQTHTFKNPGRRRVAGQHFLHFKWCKKHITDIWPEGWESMSHFAALWERAQSGKLCPVVTPKILR